MKLTEIQYEVGTLLVRYCGVGIIWILAVLKGDIQAQPVIRLGGLI
jgi:hypothetical protein